ncbi:MAG: hypothetical protein FWG66_08190 [Spirochaetes bacterium]|nr:hypothetical protein [Spirochaetota bacterium]
MSQEAIEEGLEKGIEIGEARGLEIAARKALAKGVPLETVCEFTGLDVETVLNL